MSLTAGRNPCQLLYRLYASWRTGWGPIKSQPGSLRPFSKQNSRATDCRLKAVAMPSTGFTFFTSKKHLTIRKTNPITDQPLHTIMQWFSNWGGTPPRRALCMSGGRLSSYVRTNFTEFQKNLKALGFTKFNFVCNSKINFLSFSVVIMLHLIYVFDNVLVLKNKA